MADTTLYYAETLMPRKVCALARHLASPLTYVRVDLAAAEQRSETFAALNPNCKVPVLRVGSRSIWESNAIMCFLARFAGSPLWPDDDRQIEVLRWLSWDLEHFTRHGGALYFEHIIRPAFGLGAPDDAVVREETTAFRRYAAVLDGHLADHRHLLGDALTIADFSVAAALPYADAARIPLQDFPHIARWHDRLNALPAWRDPYPASVSAAA